MAEGKVKSCKKTGCKEPRSTYTVTIPGLDAPYVMTRPLCETHFKERQTAAEILGLGPRYEDYLHRIPKVHEDVAPEAQQEWYSRHAHVEKVKRAAIGGHIVRITCSTSIGVIESLLCTVCGTEASITHNY